MSDLIPPPDRPLPSRWRTTTRPALTATFDPGRGPARHRTGMVVAVTATVLAVVLGATYLTSTTGTGRDGSAGNQAAPAGAPGSGTAPGPVSKAREKLMLRRCNALGEAPGRGAGRAWQHELRSGGADLYVAALPTGEVCYLKTQRIPGSGPVTRMLHLSFFSRPWPGEAGEGHLVAYTNGAGVGFTRGGSRGTVRSIMGLVTPAVTRVVVSTGIGPRDAVVRNGRFLLSWEERFAKSVGSRLFPDLRAYDASGRLLQTVTEPRGKP